MSKTFLSIASGRGIARGAGHYMTTSPGPVPKPVYQDLGDSLRLAGFHHFCLNVASIDETLAELRRRGVTIVTEPFELPVIGRRLAFLADPWGNLIELAQVLT